MNLWLNWRFPGILKKDRANILEGAINTHLGLKEKETKGIRPYHRPKNTVKSVNKKRPSYKTSWFRSKSDKYKTVMFVDATPNDELIKMLRNTEKRYMIDENHRIKFVSKVGMKLIHMFQRKDPFQVNCTTDDCNPCAVLKENPGELSNCKTNNVCYSAKCKTCEDKGKTKVYFGETSHNLHLRSKDRIQLCKKKSDNSFMYKQMKAEHKNNVEDVNFRFKVVAKFRKPLQRQLFESKCIEKTPSNAT